MVSTILRTTIHSKQVGTKSFLELFLRTPWFAWLLCWVLHPVKLRARLLHSGSQWSCLSSAVSNTALQIVGRRVCFFFFRMMLTNSVKVIFTSLGLMYGAPSTVSRLWYNQSAAVCGNIIGGAIFIGLFAHLMSHWKSPLFAFSGAGTFLAHDLESTRRAKDAKCFESEMSGVKASNSNDQVAGDQRETKRSGIISNQLSQKPPTTGGAIDSADSPNNDSSISSNRLPQAMEDRQAPPRRLTSQIWNWRNRNGRHKESDSAQMT
jgi:hypothetical protein